MKKDVKTIYNCLNNKCIQMMTIAFLSSFVFSCSDNNILASLNDEKLVGPSGYYASEVDSKGIQTLSESERYLRSRIGYNFLVEQFNAKSFSSMKKAIQNHPPAGIVYWNPEKVGAYEIAQVNADYSKVAEERNLGPLLLSTDYEGGGLSKTLSGKTIAGIQRFTQGFTKLAHPQWLGKSFQKFNYELCYLHGEIMAKELKLSGINYPLATVSDLAKNLFINRGVSKNSNEITSCVKEMVKAFVHEKNMIFVTKHFPGLGDTVGDTHDQTVISQAKTYSDLESSLKPFSDVISWVNEQHDSSYESAYSILASHAKYDVLDNRHLTTVSSLILNDFLKEKLGFKGLLISDAMWMGEYGSYNNRDILIVYLQSIIAGMDILMIKGSTFVPAIQFFRGIFDGSTDTDTKFLIESKIGLSYNKVRKLYLERLKETVEKMNAVKKELKYAHEEYDINNYQAPETYTRNERSRYYKMLNQLGLSL